jgi:hypothetical protein
MRWQLKAFSVSVGGIPPMGSISATGVNLSDASEKRTAVLRRDAVDGLQNL